MKWQDITHPNGDLSKSDASLCVMERSISFVLPMMAAGTEDVADGLLLRKWGVPYWMLVRLFGRNVSFWYRLEISIGRNSIVGTTVKTVPVPEHLLADEKHEKCCGKKIYIATTVAEGVFLGAEVSPSASKEDLQRAYGVFKAEAEVVEPEYVPKTVNTDGWSGTIGAWSALFMNITLIRCFLHAWLRIRERAKNLKEPVIWEIKECPIYIRTERLGVPMSKPFRLVVARNVMNEKEEEIKYFVNNAPAEEPLDNLLLAGFSRWRVERSFQDTKQKLGLGDFEGRTYTGLIRHLLLCSLAYYFWLYLRSGLVYCLGSKVSVTGYPFYPEQSKKLTIVRIFTCFQCNFAQFGILSVHQPGTQVEP